MTTNSWTNFGKIESTTVFNCRAGPVCILPKRSFTEGAPEDLPALWRERTVKSDSREVISEQMEFLFRISHYDDPALDEETAELLRQSLEAQSRRIVPGIWKVTDKLNAYAAKGPGREKRRTRYRIYGVVLIALGVFALVPGLMEPRIPSLIWAGGLAIFTGLLEFYLVRVRKAPAPPASCRKEAAELLKSRRETSWESLQAEVWFDETGWSVTTAGNGSQTSYHDLRSVFETEHLWMLVDGKNRALLLQKKDLVSGEAGEFLPYLQGKIPN